MAESDQMYNSRHHHSRVNYLSKQLNVLIAGHEHISDVNNAICKANDKMLQPNLGIEHIKTYWLGQRDGDMDWVRDVVLPTIADVKPDIVYLEIGKWDCSKTNVGVYEIVDWLATLVSVMIDQHHVQHVIVGEILQIQGLPHIRPEAYNVKVHKVNMLIKSLFQNDSHVHVCHHRAMSSRPDLFSNRNILQLELEGIRVLYDCMAAVIRKFVHVCGNTR